METWLIVCLTLLAVTVVLFRGRIYFEALFIGLLTGLIVGAIMAEPLVDDAEHVLWFAIAAPIVSFLISFFRCLPRKIFTCFWATPIFALAYSLVLWIMGIAENIQTVFVLFFSLSLVITFLMASCSFLILLVDRLVRHLIDDYTKNLEESIND